MKQVNFTGLPLGGPFQEHGNGVTGTTSPVINGEIDSFSFLQCAIAH